MCAPTIAYDPIAPWATSVRCIDPPLPPQIPFARPMSSAISAPIGAPRRSVCTWPRYVQKTRSSGRSAAANPAATASCPSARCEVPLMSPSRNRSCARFSNRRASCIIRYMSRRTVWSAIAGDVFATRPRSVLVGDHELLAREERDDLRALGRDDDLLLDAGGRTPVRGRAVGLEGEQHALLQLDRLLEGVQARDDRALVQADPDAVPELQPERVELVLEAELLGLGPDR